MNKMGFKHKITTISEFMEIPLARFIILAANFCGYDGTTNELI